MGTQLLSTHSYGTCVALHLMNFLPTCSRSASVGGHIESDQLCGKLSDVSDADAYPMLRINKHLGKGKYISKLDLTHR